MSQSIMPWRLLNGAAIAAALPLGTSPASTMTLYLSPTSSNANADSLAAGLRSLNTGGAGRRP